MNNILDEIKNVKELNFEKGLDLEVDQTINSFKKIIENSVVSGVEYAYKALDCSSEMKDSLKEIKKVFKERDFKNLLGVALNSSIKIGLEIAKKKYPMLKTLDSIKDISLKGGFSSLVGTTIDIIANKYLKGNIISEDIKRFFNDIKSFVKSNAFVDKINQGINKVKNKVEKFKEKCQEWYNAYEKFDIDKINVIASDLTKMTDKVGNIHECVKESNIIQNMTKLINNKKDKLSNTQLEICANM